MPGFVWFLLGPTATGKSALAVEIAKACGAEILSADAFQVYNGLSVLSAKPSEALLEMVPHHLIGEISLSETYDVSRFMETAKKRLHEIAVVRNRPVLIVGGTGLYVKALTHGLSPLPSGDPSLRAKLEDFETEELWKKLEALDPQEALQIDRYNRRRLVRAVEVCLMTGMPISEQRTDWSTGAQSPIHELLPVHGGSLGRFVFRDREELRKRIDHRVETMFQEGVVEEVEGVLREAVPLSVTASKMLGLAEIKALIRGELTTEECKAKIKTATGQYAKRQMTWFKRETIFQPWDITGVEDFATLDFQWVDLFGSGR